MQSSKHYVESEVKYFDEIQVMHWVILIQIAQFSKQETQFLLVVLNEFEGQELTQVI